jgi:protein CpxP
MKMIRTTRSLAVIIVLLSTPAAVWAQSAPTPSPAAPRETTADTTANNGVEAGVEARIKDLHAKLHITPAEQAQWDQFAEVMRDNAREMNKAAMEHAQQVPSMGAVEDLKSYEQLAEAHVQRLQKLIPAFESLYNTMPAQQKQVADQVFRANAESRAQNRPGQ